MSVLFDKILGRIREKDSVDTSQFYTKAEADARHAAITTALNIHTNTESAHNGRITTLENVTAGLETLLGGI